MLAFTEEGPSHAMHAFVAKLEKEYEEKCTNELMFDAYGYVVPQAFIPTPPAQPHLCFLLSTNTIVCYYHDVV